MEAFLVSTGLVAIAEIGDKTQLLAMLLAARFRKPWPIILGIFIATLLNHACASALGALAGHWLDGPWMRWVLGGLFLAFAAWALIPDKLGEDEAPRERSHGSVFLATAIAFFLVEMGDKTQVATVALAAQFQAIALVAMGTTLGMMIANAPAVFLGEATARAVPLHLIRWAAAAVFAAVGTWILAAG
ncbi:MAG: TMEM165/GDT1 family protein [Rhodospirillales bacterium]|nr:TMEM165/GDT1 family protein [Rhodospirillales bacterium]